MNQSTKRTATPAASFPPASTFFLYALGMIIPAVIAAYWPLYWHHPNTTAIVLRPAILASAILLAFLCGHHRLSRSETRLYAFLGFLCLLWLGTSLGSVDVERALQDWLKLFVLCLIALLLTRTLRNPVICKSFGYSLVAASLLIGAFIVYSYIHYIGWVIPTYQSARQFKGMAEWVGIPLNTIPFASVFAYIAGMCLVRSNRYLWAAGAVVFTISSVFTGSRAPVAVLLLSGLALLILNGIRSRQLVLRWCAWAVLILTLAGTPILVLQIPFKTMSDVTEGRWDLWYVAVQKFSERPIIGFGYESVHDDLLSRNPGVYKIRGVKELAGGYHNEYLTALAEEGLIGFIGVIALSWFMIRCSWQLAFCQWRTWHNGQWALFGALFLLLRAGVEVPGLFGYCREPVDFLAYIFLALIVSRFSIEEDCARALHRSFSRQRLRSLNAQLVPA